MALKQKDMSNISEVEKMRHTASHVLAQAVLNLYPDAKLGIGPAIDNGFYYDFELPDSINEESLPQIEAEMKKIIERDLPMSQDFKNRADAEEFLKNWGQNYKLDLFNDIPDESLSFYVTGNGEFVDLCRGPHVESTGKIGAIKLTKVAGAYWRGDEKQKMLTRIYGVAFPSQEELDNYLHMMEEAEKRDHRKLGKQLDLFSFHEEGPGFAFWHPKGMRVMNKMIEFWKEVHEKEGYVEVRTPVMLTIPTWEKSGHMQNYIEKMYLAKTNDSEVPNYAVKPMNCDGGMLIYKTRQHSYKELPIRMGELGVVHRYETSGEIHGLMRVREFTQDDAHIYCTPEQIKEELKNVIHLCLDFYKIFEMPLDHIELSTRPEKSIGSDEIWEKAESTMREVLKEEGIEHRINEGDGAFYGPKFDFHLKDSVGRTWQCGTIQLDFEHPESFDLTYTNERGELVRPVMIHRVVYGSLERFFGIMLENYAGKLPLWMAPVQVQVIPISERHNDYAIQVAQMFSDKGFYVEVDTRDEKMQAKIRDAEMQKVPYLLVVGDKEVNTNTVSVRPAGKKDLGIFKIDEFIEQLLHEVETKGRSEVAVPEVSAE